jgi:hypothetical protein
MRARREGGAGRSSILRAAKMRSGNSHGCTLCPINPLNVIGRRHQDPVQRPSMAQVVARLAKIKEEEVAPGGGGGGDAAGGGCCVIS